MKQVLQHLRTGQLEVAELPCPQVTPGSLLIQTRASLISPGTERMLVEFSKANIIQKAHQQPEKVKQVLDKIRADGLIPTLEAVFRKLDQPLPLGYCNAGVVLEVGENIHDIRPGDRVISNGPHAEIVAINRNLCARIPECLSYEQAAFTVLASIALQGIRLASPTLGERFMVFGMGPLGLLSVQLLRGSGCQVLAADINAQRLELARQYGAEIVNIAANADAIRAAMDWTANVGVDGVLITASAKNDEIVHQAAQASRKRGRIILVGVVGLDIKRSDFYEKELTFQVSCSYGPGRYDEKYEQDGHDYPLPYVRWTEQRNFEAILTTMAQGNLNVEQLVTHRFGIADAGAAYEKIQQDSSSLGVVLQYPDNANCSATVQISRQSISQAKNNIVAVIGAGNFAHAVLLPALAKTTAQIAYIADINAVAAHSAAKKFNAAQAITDYRIILDDPNVQSVFVVAGPELHARLVCESIAANKHVFVEKPLALTAEELDQIRQRANRYPDKIIMVGFNRRFSKHTAKIKDILLGRTGPLCMNMTINAGQVPIEHWVHDPKRGGGRIINEACHFIDLLSYIAEAEVTAVSAMMVGPSQAIQQDKMSIVLAFADGSVGTVNYFANGPKSYPKEMLEIFSDGRVLKLENFRTLRAFGFKKIKTFRTMRQDKGHLAEINAFLEKTKTGGDELIPLEQLINITQASFDAVETANTASIKN